MKNKIFIGFGALLVVGALVYFVLQKQSENIVVKEQTDSTITIVDKGGEEKVLNLNSYIGEPNTTLDEIKGAIEYILIDHDRDKIYIVYSNSGIPARNGLSYGIVAYDVRNEEVMPLHFEDNDIAVNNPSNLRTSDDERFLKLDYTMSDGACEIIMGTLTWDLEDIGLSAHHERRTERPDGC